MSFLVPAAAVPLLKNAECYRDLYEQLLPSRLHFGIIGCHRGSISPRKLYFRKVHAVIPTCRRTLSVASAISPAITGIIWPGRIFPRAENSWRIGGRIAVVYEMSITANRRFHRSRRRNATSFDSRFADGFRSRDFTSRHANSLADGKSHRRMWQHDVRVKH